MPAPFAIKRRVGPSGIEFESAAEGDRESKLTGQRTFDVETHDDRLEFWLSQHRGRDRDNRDYSHDADISLCEEDVRELHLLLTVWLENRG